ncbi:carbon-nitrogen hydrolase family protein [Myxococcus vastator]|uniref:carbon-nitrogen hydrolase family protein n=1 Tax=Myxococcus vastator TaxID=2709664 RepID=UPI0013D1608B|nr:carbon-nitrogen hydrolase family protein [Myxococcus vastator]
MDTTTDLVELFALQPRVSLEDYASPAAFAARHRALAAKVDALRARDASGQPRYPALVVWPESVGAPLLFLGHIHRVRRSASVQRAMKRVVLSEAWGVWEAWRDFQPPSLTECLYAARAPLVHRTLWKTFSGIARDFGLWVVAGSALLPASRRGEDSPDFEPSGARTYNTSYTFSPEGHCVATARKANLVPSWEDGLHLSPGRPEDLPVLPTPFGKLATLIGYDGFAQPYTRDEPWFVPCAQYLDAMRVDVLAHPAIHAGPGTSHAPGERWQQEGLPAQLRTLRNVRYVVSAQQVGSLFGGTFTATSHILERTRSGDVRVLAQAQTTQEEDVVHATVATTGQGTP